MRPSLLTLAACAPLLLPASLGASSVVMTVPVDLEVPDNDPSGLVSSTPYAGTGPGGQFVVSVEVVLITNGGWNGDLYAYLEHNGVISVLLNRPGNTVANPAGAASSGMSIRFSDTAPEDIHTAISNDVGLRAAGTYQPDARFADPDLVTDASPRSKFLAGFNGSDPDGLWTLFIADLSGGDVAEFGSWSLAVTAVPEPSIALLGFIGATWLLLVRRRSLI